MTTTPVPSPTGQRKVTAAPGWFPTTPTTEREILDMANSRQVALRTRLRHLYWLTDCKPIGDVSLTMVRRKMTMIDPQDAMPQEQVDELLSEHYGFAKAHDSAGGFIGWVIPDLDEAQRAAVGAMQANRLRMSELGKASAAKRGAVKRPAAGAQALAHVPEVVDHASADILEAAMADESGDF